MTPARERAPQPSANRCAWVTQDPLYVAYHDGEWGKPVRDERRLFEMLILEGAQAGLSWLTILKKRAAYRRVFAEFDPEIVARFRNREIESLLTDTGIVRNRLKVAGAVENARAWLRLKETTCSCTDHLWAFVGGTPRRNRFRTHAEVPATTRESDALSKDLRQRGFKFVGSTICYAFMQAVGMVSDHTMDCDWFEAKR